MKFLKININYREMLEDFFTKYPNISQKNYKEICNLYYNEFYWPSNFLEKKLKELYDWECNNIIFPLENNDQTSIFFKKWCEWNNLYSSLTSKYDRLIFQIVYYNPKIIYIHELTKFPEIFFEQLKLLKPSIKIIGWNCDPTSFQNLNGQKYIDNIFTCSNDIKNILIKNNFLSVTKVNHMFEPDILKSIKFTSKKYDIVFFGQLSKKWYQERIDFFKYLIKNNINITIFGKTDDEILKKYCKPAVYGKEIYTIIKESKIVLNIHSNDSKFARNIRLFEVTGIGSMLLTDYKVNMDKLFKENIEVITFKSFKDTLSKIKYYLENEEEREQIALNGQKRTINKYNYKILAKKIFKFSKKNISIKKRYKQILMINQFDTSNKKIFKNWSNELINQTKQCTNNFDKIAIYGNGNMTKLIKEYIPNLIAIFDKNATKEMIELGVYTPNHINNFEFDLIIISVLGYENEIKDFLTSKYNIEKNKIFTFDFSIHKLYQ